MTIRDFSEFFRDPAKTSDELIAVGGDLTIERLLYAYSIGVFPWSENPIRWYCLDPRAIFDINHLNLSKSAYRKIRQKKYMISFNMAFSEVIKSCSIRTKESSWITAGFIEAYTKLHQAGYAHSIEIRDRDGQLAGGIYGVSIGKFFAGESMFSFKSDAGKIALFYLFEILKKEGFQLFDTQQLNIVTWDLGAYEIPKIEYLKRLGRAVGNLEKLDFHKYNTHDFTALLKSL